MRHLPVLTPIEPLPPEQAPSKLLLECRHNPDWAAGQIYLLRGAKPKRRGERSLVQRCRASPRWAAEEIAKGHQRK